MLNWSAREELVKRLTGILVLAGVIVLAAVR